MWRQEEYAEGLIAEGRVILQLILQNGGVILHIGFKQRDSSTLNENLPCLMLSNFYILLTVHLSISFDNDQFNAHLLYFTIRPLQSSKCFKSYMLIIRRMNCIDPASGIVTVSKWPSGAPAGHLLRGGYQMLHQYNSSSWWWAYNSWNM